MRRPGQGNAIVHNIGAIVFYGSDVGSIDLRPSAPVYELEAGDGTSLVIGTKYNTPKRFVPRRPAYQMLNALALCLKLEGRYGFGKTDSLFHGVGTG